MIPDTTTRDIGDSPLDSSAHIQFDISLIIVDIIRFDFPSIDTNSSSDSFEYRSRLIE